MPQVEPNKEYLSPFPSEVALCVHLKSHIIWKLMSSLVLYNSSI